MLRRYSKSRKERKIVSCGRRTGRPLPPARGGGRSFHRSGSSDVEKLRDQETRAEGREDARDRPFLDLPLDAFLGAPGLLPGSPAIALERVERALPLLGAEIAHRPSQRRSEEHRLNSSHVKISYAV